ncbi:peptide chain release factor 2 [Alphaproteobacteria bacterium]|jgi:peptide chain release factor 2|nr:peptide chain release factor 2 [Alphaproteobacteria bacterium]MBT5798284.1 peptide chain release factor 2 [Alphaproteobacteria bacterium]MDA9815763.1 peptide chain release factor 2 [Alphaproteobacteria bacterium]MDC0461768.1 peptide chain release factor 2 [Alphaproteobacteria bacterium]
MQAETQHSLDAIKQAIDLLKQHVDWQQALNRISEIEAKSSEPDFWNDQQTAQDLMREKTTLETQIQNIRELQDGLTEQLEMLELANDEQDEELIHETENSIKQLSLIAGKKQIASLLSGEADKNNCFVEIHSGAGGTEAQDWASMLLRMYIRWAEHRGFKVEVIDQADGEEAGIKSTTIRIAGDSSYGWMKTESGVHRLVRISPFDSSARRHTSFSSVWVYPEIDDNIDIEVEEKDLRVDTFRASGAGGQHVNTTDSAIRITHIPTNIIVQCQSDRSQHRNRATAMKMLRARLYELELQKRENAAIEGNASKAENGWGSQIRSYVLHPYQMVKDLRTQVETGNTQAVLDGDIDDFIEAGLAARVGMTR